MSHGEHRPKDQLTRFGFNWGPMEVTRACSDGRYRTMLIRTPYVELQVHVSDGGRSIRTFQTRTRKRIQVTSNPIDVSTHGPDGHWDCADIARLCALRDSQAQEIARLRAALRRAHAELDDILEDWQLEGRHGQTRYEQLKRETAAAESALNGSADETEKEHG